MVNKPNKPNNSTETRPSPVISNQTTEPAVLDAKVKRKAAKGLVDFSIGARAFISKDTTWK